MEERKGQIRDLNSRMVFREPLLCAQFLRDYVDIDLLNDIQPEDIEDVSEKYQAYLGISFETDSVKKIRIRSMEAECGEMMPLYLISLIEHKSEVDYNVSMQLLRYMACIWHEYAKEVEKNGGENSSNKEFRYPPILPIVYYEGTGKWTAAMHLKDRIMMSGIFGDYLPDFTYKLVRNHDYTNEELLDRKDEMSLLMMLNKVQTPEDMTEFLEVNKEKMFEIFYTAPEHILGIMESAVWSLCMKMNMPLEEAAQCVEKVRKREMGYWFASMEKMDIQAERRNTAEAKREAEEMRQKLCEAEQRQQEAEQRRQEAEQRQQESARETIKAIISLCKELGGDKETAINQLMEKAGLTREAEVGKYWN